MDDPRERPILEIDAVARRFCIAGALSATAEFRGSRAAESLVRIVRATATTLRGSRASFVHANIDSFIDPRDSLT